MAPLRALRVAYLPLLAVYFASGAMGLIAVADAFWVKKQLALTPADLAALAVWLQLPWTAKIVVSELVDAVPLLGSQRRSYIFVGAGLVAAGLLLLSGAAGGWLTFGAPERIYVFAQLVIVAGAVIQEVVADALSAEVVADTHGNGKAKDKGALDAELAMVQVLARLAYCVGALVVAWLGGVLASALAYDKVFLIGLAIPLSSVSGVLCIRGEQGNPRPVDRRIAGTGLGLAATATLLGLLAPGLGQEIAFLVALSAVCVLSRRRLKDLDAGLVRRITAVAAAVFAFRAVPTLGDGYRWFTMDRLGFDERFFGVLQLTGTGVGLAVMWLLSGPMSRGSARGVLLVLTGLAALLWLPSVLLAHGAHEWTERVLGFGARSIALVDEAAQSPLGLLATVPLLTLIALHAPAAHRATWFALAASLMSLAIVASQLLTKYLNVAFAIDRGLYDNVGMLAASVVGLSLVMPLAFIALLWRRLD